MLQYLSQEDQKWVQETLQKVTEKMKVVRERAQKKIPFTSKGGVYDDHSGEKEINWWTNGSSLYGDRQILRGSIGSVF